MTPYPADRLRLYAALRMKQFAGPLSEWEARALERIREELSAYDLLTDEEREGKRKRVCWDYTNREGEQHRVRSR